MINSKFKYRIYGRLKGRKKKKIINLNYINDYKINITKDLIINNQNIVDIGSGNGENSIFLSKKNPQSFIIACEIFEDGNINLYNKLFDLKLKNVKIFNGNVLELIDCLSKDSYFNEIWILFPDPWPKKRHHKRRLINYNFFKIIYPLLKDIGKVYISTDSVSYLKSIIKNVYEIKELFKWENDNPTIWNYSLQELPKTKFFNKAQKSNKTSFFIELTKI